MFASSILIPMDADILKENHLKAYGMDLLGFSKTKKVFNGFLIIVGASFLLPVWRKLSKRMSDKKG